MLTISIKGSFPTLGILLFKQGDKSMIAVLLDKTKQESYKRFPKSIGISRCFFFIVVHIHVLEGEFKKGSN